MKPRYMGPMVVLRRMTGGLYMLAELDGSVSKFCFAAFHLVPYHAHTSLMIPPSTFTDLDDEELDDMAGKEDVELDDEESRSAGHFTSD